MHRPPIATFIQSPTACSPSPDLHSFCSLSLPLALAFWLVVDTVNHCVILLTYPFYSFCAAHALLATWARRTKRLILSATLCSRTAFLSPGKKETNGKWHGKRQTIANLATKRRVEMGAISHGRGCYHLSHTHFKPKNLSLVLLSLSHSHSLSRPIVVATLHI